MRHFAITATAPRVSPLWLSMLVLMMGLFALATSTRAVADSQFAGIEKGRYLVAAGDCAACHTAEGGQPFAGGRAVPTPFGTIFATNITPDADTGIGNWTEQDFYRAIHDGIRRDGEHLYPAFPYPWYTHLTRADVHDIYEFLRSVPAVRQENKPPELPWPLSWRAMMAVWNRMFFKPATFHPDTTQTAQWNRGAYLVEGFGHCSACHSPKNVLGAVERDKAYTGGFGEHWYAPAVTNNRPAGLGSWSQADIVRYLKAGANVHAGASGPMAEVVEHSTSQLDDDDLQAIAVYLKSLRSSAPAEAKVSTDHDVLARGAAVYVDQCMGCHMRDGRGQPGIFPPLAGNSVVQAKDASNVVRAIVDGSHEAATAAKPTAFAMPAFGCKLTDRDIADVTTYLRSSFGNAASPVTESDVHHLRDKIRRASLP